MAQAIRRYTCELTRPITMQNCNDLMATGDERGHQFVITLLRDGVPVNDCTTCTGYLIRPDGSTTVMCVGTIAGNVATVALPEAAYKEEGYCNFVIRVSNANEKLVVFYSKLYIIKSQTDQIVTEEHVLSLDEMLVMIERMERESSEAITGANAAATKANTAAANADTATGKANTATANANTAATNANAAKDAANAAAETANTAAANAGAATNSAVTATTNANKATQDANKATADAKTATANAVKATTDAASATSAANAASESANTAAGLANSATAEAKTATQAANEAAERANASASAADQATENATAAAGSANAAATSANEAATAANQAKENADTATAAANSAAETALGNAERVETAIANAETATQNANTATTNAETATEAANTATERANTAAKRAEDAASESLPLATTTTHGVVKIGDKLTVTEEGVLSADEQFSEAERAKLDGIEDGANNYTLPAATGEVLGGVKVGANLSIDENGVLSADEQRTDMTPIEERLTTAESNIATLRTDLDIKASKEELEDLRAEIEGYEFRTVTEKHEAYSVDVPSKVMPFSSIGMIGSKSVVWNQLFNLANIAQQSGQVALSVSGNNITASFSRSDGRLWSVNTLSNNHKYFGYCKYTASISGKFMIELSKGWKEIASATSPANTETVLCGIVSVGDSSDVYNRGFAFGCMDGTLGAYTVTVKNPMLVDLTLLYGAGNEPTTVEQFRRDFPEDYYPYSEPTIKSAKVKSVDPIGLNLIDPSKCLDNTYMSPNGVATTHPTYPSFVTAYIPIDPAKNYYIENCVNLFTAASFCYFDANKTFIKYGGFTRGGIDSTVASGLLQSSSGDIPSNACYIRANGEMAHKNDIMLCVSDTVVPYVPYKRISLPISSSVRSIEGYGWSAGDAYNYIDMDRKVFVKRVGRVDLGTLNWAYYQGYSGFNARSPEDVKLPLDGNHVINAICGSLIQQTDNDFNTHTAVDNSFAKNVSTLFKVRISSAGSDVSALKSKLSGVYLYYELATPIETPIDLPSNILQVEPNGTILFEQEDGNMHIPVPIEISYVKHLGGDT